MSDPKPTPTLEEKKLELDRRKQNLDFIKFFLGTLLLGTLGLFINREIQNGQIELQSRKTDAEYLDKFIKQYVNAGAIQKKEFVEFMRYASHSEETRNLYKTFSEHLSVQIDSLNYAKAKSKYRLESALALAFTLSKQKDSIKSFSNNIHIQAEKKYKELLSAYETRNKEALKKVNDELQIQKSINQQLMQPLTAEDPSSNVKPYLKRESVEGEFIGRIVDYVDNIRIELWQINEDSNRYSYYIKTAGGEEILGVLNSGEKGLFMMDDLRYSIEFSGKNKAHAPFYNVEYRIKRVDRY